MKLLFFLFGIILNTPSPQLLLILDKALKKPVLTSTGFDETQYMHNCFPVYAADANAIIKATDEAVKHLDKMNSCFSSDTITAAHSMFILQKDCEDGVQYFNVLLVTMIEESKNSFSFSILAKEGYKRKAQQKLLDFATYLSQ